MITVLLVHDNTELIDATRSYLERMGEVRVDSVNSTKQAIEVLKNRAYDVIVSYYHLPVVDGIEFLGDMNGVELLKYLKQQGNTTPFILYARNPGNKVVLEDINYASEMVVSARTPLSELRDIIKQAVLRKRSGTRAELPLRDAECITVRDTTGDQPGQEREIRLGQYTDDAHARVY